MQQQQRWTVSRLDDGRVNAPDREHAGRRPDAGKHPLSGIAHLHRGDDARTTRSSHRPNQPSAPSTLVISHHNLELDTMPTSGGTIDPLVIEVA
jgi:hypothetical protein